MSGLQALLGARAPAAVEHRANDRVHHDRVYLFAVDPFTALEQHANSSVAFECQFAKAQNQRGTVSIREGVARLGVAHEQGARRRVSRGVKNDCSSRLGEHVLRCAKYWRKTGGKKLRQSRDDFSIPHPRGAAHLSLSLGGV